MTVGLAPLQLDLHALGPEMLELAAPSPKQTTTHVCLTRLDLFQAAWPVDSAMALGHSI